MQDEILLGFVEVNTYIHGELEEYYDIAVLIPHTYTSKSELDKKKQHNISLHLLPSKGCCLLRNLKY